MFNVAINTVSAASHIETVFDNGQEKINHAYNNGVKPFVADCFDSCGFPPLQEAIDFFRSDNGKKLVRNVLTGVKVYILVMAFLSIAVVMGLAFTFAKAWEIYQDREEVKAAVVAYTVRTKREAKVFIWMAKREVRRHQREAAKRLVSALDRAAGVNTPTFQ